MLRGTSQVFYSVKENVPFKLIKINDISCDVKIP